MTTMTGGCHCGRIRYTAEIASDEAYLCHCRMCQRTTGNVSIAFVNVLQAAVTWAGTPDWYRSSAIAERPFCAACGTSLGFRYVDGSDKMDLTVASFDEPRYFRPTSHFGVESMHVAWINTTDLPQTQSDSYEPLTARWMNAVGKLPD